MAARYDDLTAAMGDLDEAAFQRLLEQYIETQPGNAMELISAINQGMVVVGNRFSSFEYFVGDLIFAGDIYSNALERLRPLLLRENTAASADKKVILCTVEGDIHDIGKNIVKYTMESYGLTVIDLGVNVSPATVLARTMEEGASVVALSAMLSYAHDSMARTVSAFRESGIRSKVKILIGGGCASEEIVRLIRADAYGRSPDESARICAQWLGLGK